MALIDRDSALQKALRHLARMESGGVEILSYKRNRGVSILLVKDRAVLVQERGYVDASTIMPFADAEKHLKAVIKREFPRSRKVRLSLLAGPEDLNKAKKVL